MASSNEYVTQSDVKKNPKKYNPDFDLIMADSLAQNEWPKQLKTGQPKGDEHLSIMAQIMTKDLFEKLKVLKTSTDGGGAGWTMARAINTGVCYPNSFVGCHAGDAESYTLFKDLFHPAIEKYHIGYKMDGSQKHITDMNPDKISTALTQDAKDKIVSTRIRVARNLKCFPLNPGGTLETRMKIAEVMEKVFASFGGDLAGTFYRHSDMTAQQEKELVDGHYLFRGKDKMQAASGYHQFWNKGRGIFLNKTKTFIVWVNEGDHIRIISMEQGGDIKSVFTRLSRAIAAIESALPKAIKSVTKETVQAGEVFASDPVLGLITCCPSNLGTGMRGSVHIKVPTIAKAYGLEKIDPIAREKAQCQARGSSGEHSEIIDRVDIGNWRRLGFTEYSLVDDLIKGANLMSALEDEAIKKEANISKIDIADLMKGLKLN